MYRYIYCINLSMSMTAFVSKFVVVGYLKKSPVLASIFNLVQDSLPLLTIDILQVDHREVLHLSSFFFLFFPPSNYLSLFFGADQETMCVLFIEVLSVHYS